MTLAFAKALCQLYRQLTGQECTYRAEQTIEIPTVTQIQGYQPSLGTQWQVVKYAEQCYVQEYTQRLQWHRYIWGGTLGFIDI